MEEKYYDVLVSVKVYARVSAESEEEAVRIANSGSACEIFPDDIMADDIVSVEYAGSVYESDEE